MGIIYAITFKMNLQCPSEKMMKIQGKTFFAIQRHIRNRFKCSRFEIDKITIIIIKLRMQPPTQII